MKRRTVIKTSVFPAPKEVVFSRLKERKTLQYVAAPFATFSPLNGAENLTWKKNCEYGFRFKLFGLLPLGRHTIRVVEFDETSYDIYTNERNTHVPLWNHRITLKTVEAGKTLYTDEVEIYAGWKTPFVYLWAKSFYGHRHRKWIRLLQNSMAQ